MITRHVSRRNRTLKCEPDPDRAAAECAYVEGYRRLEWRCLGRNAILQKEKWRCVDNGKRSKHNKATSMKERITCGRADFPALIAREIASTCAGAVRHAAICMAMAAGGSARGEMRAEVGRKHCSRASR